MLEPRTPGRRAETAVRAREATVVAVIRMRVVLIDIVPPIWRRLQVLAECTLRRLHTALQHAIGWKNIHPHRFRVGTELFGRPSGLAEPVRDSRWITLGDVHSRGIRAFTYEYGFPDGWTHAIRIESVAEAGPAGARPICLGGERACPPETSGGPDGYVDGLQALPGSFGPELSETPDWLRHGFDPERFDLEAVNAALSSVK